MTAAPQPGSFLEGPWQDLVAAMRATRVDEAAEEHAALFVGAGKADVLPYGSFHIAGTLNDQPLVALRTDLAALGLASAAPEGETEDHVSFVFEVMRYLIAGDDLAVCNLEQQRRFFRAHVQPWVAHSLCDAVEQHPAAQRVRGAGALHARVHRGRDPGLRSDRVTRACRRRRSPRLRGDGLGRPCLRTARSVGRTVRTGTGNDGTVSGLRTAAAWIRQLAHSPCAEPSKTSGDS